MHLLCFILGTHLFMNEKKKVYRRILYYMKKKLCFFFLSISSDRIEFRISNKVIIFISKLQFTHKRQKHTQNSTSTYQIYILVCDNCFYLEEKK